MILRSVVDPDHQMADPIKKKVFPNSSLIAASALPALDQCEIPGAAEAEFHLQIVW